MLETSVAQALPPALHHQDFPPLFNKVDVISIRKKRNYLWGVRAELLLLVVGALAGLGSYTIAAGASSLDILGVVAVAAFLTSLIIQFIRFQNHPDITWYAARAVAESVKRLTWLYSMGGSPFPKSSDDATVETRFQEQVQAVLHTVVNQTDDTADQARFKVQNGGAITPVMRQYRALDLPTRRELYLTRRINDQQRWYAKKALQNKRGANGWSYFLQTIEFIGVVIAFLKLFNIVQLDLLSVVGLLATAGISWLQSQQHQTLAQSYAIAATELGKIAASINTSQDEAQWANFVGNAEQAISREHTAWVATHVSPAFMIAEST
jgi:hypothetical protein